MTTDKRITDELRRKMSVPADMSDAELLRFCKNTFALASARLAVAARDFIQSVRVGVAVRFFARR